MQVNTKLGTISMSIEEWEDVRARYEEARRCLHIRLRTANAHAGKLMHVLAGGIAGVLLGVALKGC